MTNRVEKRSAKKPDFNASWPLLRTIITLCFLPKVLGEEEEDYQGDLRIRFPFCFLLQFDTFEAIIIPILRKVFDSDVTFVL